jgi:hypothetical protein
MQETLKKAAQIAQLEPPKKKYFTFRYWITTKDANTEGNEFIKYVTGAPIPCVTEHPGLVTFPNPDGAKEFHKSARIQMNT